MTIVNSITAIRQPGFAPSSSRNGQHHPAAQRARSGAFVHGGSGGRVGRKQYGTAVVAHGGVSAGSSRAGSAEWPMAANNVVPIEAPARAPTVHQVPYSASRPPPAPPASMHPHLQSEQCAYAVDAPTNKVWAVCSPLLICAALLSKFTSTICVRRLCLHCCASQTNTHSSSISDPVTHSARNVCAAL